MEKRQADKHMGEGRATKTNGKRGKHRENGKYFSAGETAPIWLIENAAGKRWEDTAGVKNAGGRIMERQIWC